MVFPVVESLTETSLEGNETSHLINMPATVDSGDLLITLFSNDDVETVTTPIGWSLLGNMVGGSLNNGDRLSIYAKRADGTEGGTTVDFVTSDTEEAAGQVYRITGWGGIAPNDVEISSFAVEDSDSPDPSSLSPSWGALDTLWLAISNHHDGDRSITAYPTNYTDGSQITTSGAAGTSLQSARRELNASSDDPGTFTIDTSRRWAAVTLAVRPERISDDPITIQNTLQVVRIPSEIVAY